MRLERHSAVIAEDLPRIHALIARADPAAAERVLDAVELTFDQLAREPECGVVYRTRNRKLPEMRMLPVVGFANYLVFYQVQFETVRVLHVVHGARHLPRLFRREPRQ